MAEAFGYSPLRIALDARSTVPASELLLDVPRVLMPALWRLLMDRRLDALAAARSNPASDLPYWLGAEHCR